MLFSYCVPIRNRAEDFKQALPTVLEAARKSPPVEIVVLDYGSSDGLSEYIRSLNAPEIAYFFLDEPYFHMARARNLAMNAGKGAYLVSTNADTLLDSRYFRVVRDLVEQTKCDVALAGEKRNGVIVVKRGEFHKSGGFDERFEFYGPEDKDLVNRMKRRGLVIGRYNPNLLRDIPTPSKKKVEGYRLPISKREMNALMRPIFVENEAEGRLTANAT